MKITNYPRFIVYLIVFTVVVKTITIIAWETTFREPVLEKFETPTEFVATSTKSVPTEFDYWLASSTTQDLLQLEFKKYQRKTLDDEIYALQSKR